MERTTSNVEQELRAATDVVAPTAVRSASTTGLTDRSAGAGSVVLLLPCGVLVAVTAVVWWRTRRTGPALT